MSASAASLVLYSNFNPSNVRFGAVEKNRKGGKMINVFDASTNRPIVIQTPACHVPFGVSAYNDTSSGEIQSYSLDLSFRGADTDPRMATFAEKMGALDDIILDAATQNSEAWLGKQMSRELTAEFYRHLVKPSSDPRWAPTLKTKIAMNRGEPAAIIFDADKKPVTLADIPKGATVRAIIEIGSVWFVGKNFGVTLKVRQVIIVSKPSTILNTFGFIEDEAAPENDAAHAAAPFLDD